MATCWSPSTLKGRGAQEEAAEARPRVKIAADRGVRPVISARGVGVVVEPFFSHAAHRTRLTVSVREPHR